MEDTIKKEGAEVNVGENVSEVASDIAQESVQNEKGTEQVNNNLSEAVVAVEEEDDETAIEIATLDELSKSISVPKPKEKTKESDTAKLVPKYKKSNKKLKKIRNIIIVVAIIVLCIYLLGQFGAYKIAKELAKFDNVTQVDNISKRDISETISTTGRIQSKDVRTLTSSLGAMTTIESVNVEVGDIVNKGDVVVTFSRENIDKKIANLEDDIDEAKSSQALASKYNSDSHNNDYATAAQNSVTASLGVTQASEDINTAQAALDRAVSLKADFMEDYQEAVANKDSIRKEMDYLTNLYTVWGQIYRGQTAGQVDPEQFPDWAGDYEDAARYFAFLTTDTQWKNYISDLQKKYNEYVGTIDSYDNQLVSYENNIISAQNNLKSAKMRYDQSVNSQITANTQLMTSITNSDYNYASKNITAGDSVNNLRRQMEEYQDSIDDYIIYAPISGVVTSVTAEEGNGWMSSAGSLMTIQAIDEFEVTTQIDEYDVNKVQEGQKVVIKTDATGDDELIGVVSFISPTATVTNNGTSTTTTYEVDINVVSTDARLKLGMSAKLNIIINQHPGVLAVRYDAIEENANGDKVVYLVDAADAAKIQEKNEERTKKSSEKKSSDSDGQKKKSKKDDDEQTFIQYLFSKKDKDEDKEGTGISDNAKEIVVQVGLEDDYYTEISSKDIKDGDYVLVNGQSGNVFDGLNMMYGGGNYRGGGPGR